MFVETKTKFVYFNHRGETEERTVELSSLDYVAKPRNDFQHSPGWFLTGLDYSRGRNGEPRSFELSSIQMPEEGFDHGTHLVSYTIPFPIYALKREIEGLETLRPTWAQGFTDESVAAQVNSSAVGQLWKMLGVDNQTDAVARLKGLLVLEEESKE